ncbi:MAG: sulfite reductase [Clostridiales bacterium]|nr:MAG: sulfite reductase [Clostridiales bacterium]
MLTIEKSKLSEMLVLLNNDYQVIVPTKADNLTQYAAYDKVAVHEAELYLGENPTMSPKYLFLPQSEAMYAFKANGKKLAIAELTPQQEKMRLLFGVRHCDIRGIACLDEVFLDERHVDPQYLEKRKNTVIIALACNETKPSCFCESMDINRTEADKDVADVQVYESADSYAFMALSNKGEAVLAKIKDLGSEKEIAAPKVSEQKIKVETKGLPEKLSGMFYDEIWNNFMFKCIGCGTCTFVCPTCYCFDINNKIRGDEGVKLRTWDSCMFDEYMLMAGGHNPRPTKKERVRNRFLHKLEYFYENYQMMLCTGCGRCLQKCPMNIDIVKFIKTVNAK